MVCFRLPACAALKLQQILDVVGCAGLLEGSGLRPPDARCHVHSFTPKLRPRNLQ